MTKCPICGFISSKSGSCPQCSSLPEVNHDNSSLTTRAYRINLTSAKERPEWRREVAEKVKAYGERKRNLITPPRPFEEKTETAIATEEVSSEEPPTRVPQKAQPLPEEPRIQLSPPPPPQVPLSPAEETEVFPDPDPEPDPPPPPPRKMVARTPQPRPERKPQHPPATRMSVQPLFDVWTEDLQQRAAAAEAPRKSATPLYLWRRAAALLVDSTIVIVLISVVLFAAHLALQIELPVLLRQKWLEASAVSVFLHLCYYLYFYSTSRQTPGQVFFALELRSSGSRNIPFHRVFARWLFMVLFNLLNFAPVLAGKKKLLLDEFSGTEIRSLK